jgi:flagellar biosynthetic protein FliR
MELLELLKDDNVIKFLLLFIRFAVIFAFFPFFSHQSISVSIKGAMAFYMTILFFPILPPSSFNEFNVVDLILAGLAEAMLGIMVSILLMLTFYVLLFAGEQIATVMGLTMANIMDPNTQTQTTVLGQILNMLALLIFLTFDGHHMVLLFMNESLTQVPLGKFVFEGPMVTYYIKAMAHFYVLGFSMAFPIIAIGIMADTIFGMIMKTMPQFNLLVIGLPIKIILAFIVLGAILGGIMFIWKKEFLIAFESLQMFFG